MREALRDVAVILLVLEAMVILLVPLAITFASWYGVRWLRRKLPPLFAQARKILARVKLYVERGGTTAVAPIIAAYAAVAQLRAWWDYVTGLVREDN
jgi:hypothetical protein